MENKTSDIIPYLISYLSSAGDLLEDLKVKYFMRKSYDIEDLVLSVSTSCPKLTRFYSQGPCPQRICVNSLNSVLGLGMFPLIEL
eukprot:scaffold4017_cov199-Ochromonas_danica.AAC.3